MVVISKKAIEDEFIKNTIKNKIQIITKRIINDVKLYVNVNMHLIFKNIKLILSEK